MKRFFTLLFIVLGASPLLYSQITMTKASHGFLSGQSHECQAVQNQAPGEAGTNCLWDFSQATLLDDTKSVAELSEENFGTVAKAIKASRDGECDFFFNITESANEFWGYKAGNGRYLLTEPIVKTRYPQTYGTQFSGRFAGTYTVEGTDHINEVEGTYSTYADGIGVVVLPGDQSFPALRVRTTEAYTAFERVKYLWYTQDIRLPLFVVIEDYSIVSDGIKTLSSAHSYLNVQAKSPSAIQTPIANVFSCQVFPNPFKDKLQLTYSLDEPAFVTIALYASDGAKLVTLVSNQEKTGTHSLSKDVSKYTQAPGVYMLRITAGDKTYTEKLVKTY